MSLDFWLRGLAMYRTRLSSHSGLSCFGPQRKLQAREAEGGEYCLTYLAQFSLQKATIFLGVNGDADTPACTSFSKSGEQASRRSATRARTSARSCRTSTI